MSTSIKTTTPTSESVTDKATPTTESSASLTGRSVFLVQTVAAGVSVHTAFLTEQQKLLEAPAVFPDLSYALSQIDELRSLVMQHFAQAAQVGVQVIAAQSANVPATSDTAEP